MAVSPCSHWRGSMFDPGRVLVAPHFCDCFINLTPSSFLEPEPWLYRDRGATCLDRDLPVGNPPFFRPENTARESEKPLL